MCSSSSSAATAPPPKPLLITPERSPSAAKGLRPRPLPLRALPWHKSLNEWPVEEYSTGWARACSECGSPLLDVEKNGWGCNQRKWHLEPPETLPVDPENPPVGENRSVLYYYSDSHIQTAIYILGTVAASLMPLASIV